MIGYVYLKERYKQKDDTSSKMKKVGTPLTFSKKIMLSSLNEATQIMNDKFSYKPYSDSFQYVDINNTIWTI